MSKMDFMMLSLGSMFFVIYYLAITTHAPYWTIYLTVLALFFAFCTAGYETKELNEEWEKQIRKT